MLQIHLTVITANLIVIDHQLCHQFPVDERIIGHAGHIKSFDRRKLNIRIMIDMVSQKTVVLIPVVQIGIKNGTADIHGLHGHYPLPEGTRRFKDPAGKRLHLPRHFPGCLGRPSARCKIAAHSGDIVGQKVFRPIGLSLMQPIGCGQDQ